MNAQMTNYRAFMGVCWKKVAALQDAAKELLAADGGDV